MDEMHYIDDLDEVAESVAAGLEPHMGLVAECASRIPKSEHPFTLFALLSFVPKIESIRIAIFALAELEEFYSAKILFRSAIEHFLKFQYVWFRYLDEKSDDAGIDYFVFGSAKEELDFAKSLQAKARLLGEQMHIDTLEVLKQFDKRLKDETSQSLRMRAKQFAHRNIVSYVYEKLNSTDQQLKLTFLSNIIPAYSELSSFVHGGPGTLRFSKAYSRPEVGRRELRVDAGLSLQMSLAAKAQTYLLLARTDNRLLHPLRVMSDALDTKFRNQQGE